MNWTGHTALITGAGSGIGRALAHALHARGCALILTEIDHARLEQVASELTGSAAVETVRLDVTDRDAISDLPSKLSSQPTLLFNNAGVAVGGDFTAVSETDFDWLLSINLFGPIRMTRAFLPVLRTAPESVIVNISSLFGLIAPAGQTAYCASKYGLRGFSDALRHELSASTVHVMTVHPGGVRTAIADDARLPAGMNDAQDDRDRMNAFLKMPPEQAALIILDGIERRKRRVLIGRDAKIAALIERIFPDSYWTRLSRLASP
ncbi:MULTISPECIES: SDR family NAD(P)-dependent oxidoreductase [Hyphobacterium]|uniref:SDR family NAD(P)-dependent oxidoreductase n=1 Tax=Hyphobacterium vulgare TaxID=1736751 RepID=A0ABV6ZTN8_9PROT